METKKTDDAIVMAPRYRKFLNKLRNQLFLGEYIGHNYNKIYFFLILLLCSCSTYKTAMH